MFYLQYLVIYLQCPQSFHIPYINKVISIFIIISFSIATASTILRANFLQVFTGITPNGNLENSPSRFTISVCAGKSEKFGHFTSLVLHRRLSFLGCKSGTKGFSMVKQNLYYREYKSVS